MAPRILFVEDKKCDVVALMERCGLCGWEVVQAVTFMEALAYLMDSRELFHLVVLDIMLAWGDNVPPYVHSNFNDDDAGVHLLEIMRQREPGLTVFQECFPIASIGTRHQETPVIALTNRDGAEDRCWDLNVRSFFPKSCSHRTLFAEMQRIILEETQKTEK